MQEPEPALALKNWLKERGGEFHADAVFTQDAFGYRIIAAKEIPEDSSIASCPVRLVITPDSCRSAISEVVGNPSDLEDRTATWTERQWIATYLSLHWIVGEHKSLIHMPYLNTLPTADKLRTSLHFISSELDLFKGSNLYGATLDREREWKDEWEQCRKVIADTNFNWGEQFTWTRYLTTATYVSSRAFPSYLLSPSSGAYTQSPHPILIPGVDSLNHARDHRISWLLSPRDDLPTKDASVVLVHHPSARQGQELFNNYGVKPNAELILGYGFSLPSNPDDTIGLKLGGITGQRWDVGRDAINAEGLWNEVLSTFVEGGDVSTATYEDVVDAAGSLQEMVEGLLDRLPGYAIPESVDARPEVIKMFQNYIEGQRDIMTSLLDFAREREEDAVELARQQGVDLVLEDE